jgi:adenosylhomocysteine nucleosidase
MSGNEGVANHGSGSIQITGSAIGRKSSVHNGRTFSHADSREYVVVLTALNLEFAAVRAHLTEVREHKHDAGTLFEVGRLPGADVRVVLAVIGEGNQAAAVLTERSIATFAPAALLFVGVAGGLRDDLSIGDVVVATRVYAYHGGKEETSAFRGRPRAFETSHYLEQTARSVERNGSWTDHLSGGASPTVHFKPIAAGEVVLNSRTSPLARQLSMNYNDAVAIEMESSGVAHAGHLNGSAATMTIRGISDQADGHKHAADRAGGQTAAATNAAAFGVALIRRISPAVITT